jgi:hypothetical protein
VGLARQVWMRLNAFIHERIFAHPNVLVQKAHSAMESTSGWNVAANWDAALNPKK